jgi:hypothetical protein
MITNTSSNTNNRKIAGFFKQIVIISWKNGILFRRNKFGFVCELLFSSLFTFIFVILVYYSSPTYGPRNNPQLNNVIIDSKISIAPDFLTYMFYYYPSNKFIENVVQTSISKLSFNKNSMRAIPSNISDASLLKDYQKDSLFAFISFPSEYESIDSLPHQIQYSIYTRE